MSTVLTECVLISLWMLTVRFCCACCKEMLTKITGAETRVSSEGASSCTSSWTTLMASGNARSSFEQT